MIFGLLNEGADHSSVLGSNIRLEPSMGQGLSNEPDIVKIGRLEPRFLCRQRKSLKVKNIQT
jgi:hypothetical protein